MVILTLLYLHPYDSIVKTKQRRNVQKQTTFSLELTANATWTRRRSDEYIYIFVLLTPPMSPYCLSFSVLLNLLLEQRNIEPIWFRIPCWRLATSSWTESVNALHHTTARSIIRSDFFFLLKTGVHSRLHPTSLHTRTLWSTSPRDQSRLTRSKWKGQTRVD